VLSYRLPREPSTPRITIWRKLKRLGVAQIGDGVVALPADARTREHLEWIAEEIIDAHGTAVIWLAQPTTPTAERELAGTMAAARTAEYAHVITEATAATHLEAPERAAVARRLRAEMRRIHRRLPKARSTPSEAPCSSGSACGAAERCWLRRGAHDGILTTARSSVGALEVVPMSRSPSANGGRPSDRGRPVPVAGPLRGVLAARALGC
jgi:hypothetical protein